MKKIYIAITVLIVLLTTILFLYFYFDTNDTIKTKEPEIDKKVEQKQNAITKETKKLEKNNKKQNLDKQDSKQETSLTQALNNYLNKSADAQNIAIVVKSLTTNQQFEYNAEKSFFAASTYKLPLAMLYYESDIDLNTTLTITEDVFDSGVISENYQVGDALTIKTLLEYMIIDSDNTAGNMLYNYYGGWVKFLTDASKYSTSTNYYAISNLANDINASYLSDALAYLYEHSAQFSDLINNLKQASSTEYLHTHHLHTPIAQKYGSFDEYLNIAGIVYTNNAYSIVVLTNNLLNGEEVIAEINDICYKYFNKN